VTVEVHWCWWGGAGQGTPHCRLLGRGAGGVDTHRPLLPSGCRCWRERRNGYKVLVKCPMAKIMACVCPPPVHSAESDPKRGSLPYLPGPPGACQMWTDRRLGSAAPGLTACLRPSPPPLSLQASACCQQVSVAPVVRSVLSPAACCATYCVGADDSRLLHLRRLSTAVSGERSLPILNRMIVETTGLDHGKLVISLWGSTTMVPSAPSAPHPRMHPHACLPSPSSSQDESSQDGRITG
jgi:hypothetical protein